MSLFDLWIMGVLQPRIQRLEIFIAVWLPHTAEFPWVVCRLKVRFLVAKYPCLHLYHNLWLSYCKSYKKKSNSFILSMLLSFAYVYYLGIYLLTLCPSIVNHFAGYLFGFGKKKKMYAPNHPPTWASVGWKTSRVILTVKSSQLHDGFGPEGQVSIFSVILCSFASTFVPSMVVGCLLCTCFVRSRKDLLDRQQPTSQVSIWLLPHPSTFPY